MGEHSLRKVRKHRKAPSFMLYIKVVAIVVVFSAFISYLVVMPDSMSFFTAESVSEKITIEFGDEEQ